ncbi:MAG: DUF1761 domain-containing protein [Candidatus Eremiobacteraeota bacterium]|nr:DUF1761 domain-containing protein [Candidatus Eremiobacteraeota bacterium]
MPFNKINHLAVFVAAIVFFLWGWLWYTIFGNQWLALVGKAAASMTPSPAPYVVGFLMALVLAYGTAIALADSDRPGAAHGVSFGIFMGVIFYASTMLTGYLFEGRPLGLWLINAGYGLTGFALVGAIVGGWRKRAVAA